MTVTGPAYGDPVLTGAGSTAPIVGRSDNGVIFQIPWNAAVGSTMSLDVPGNQSVFEEVHYLTVGAGAPIFYTLPGSSPSANYAFAIHQDFSALVSDSSPAQPGEIVHIYATDLGNVAPPIATGEITPTGTLYGIQNPFACSFYQQGTTYVANILFVGLAPGMIGVNQLDIVMPAEATGPVIGLRCDLWHGVGLDTGITQLPVASR